MIETNPASFGYQIPLPERKIPRRSSNSLTSHFRGAFLAISVALCGATAAFAQSSWSTVDDIGNGWQRAIAADRPGHVFVAGDVEEEGIMQGCITTSSDQGTTWTSVVHSEVDSYAGLAAATVEIAPATDTTPAVLQDQLVAAGTLNGLWITRKSLDAGVTWQTVDVFQHSTSNSQFQPDITGVTIDSGGNLYVVGYASKITVVKNKSSLAYYWLVRKIARDAPAATSEVGKATYDLFETANGGYSHPHGVACVGTNVFVAGVSGDRWQVRKNSGGTPWGLVDDFRYDPSYPSQANAITADSAGNLYVVGFGKRSLDRTGRFTPGYWIVRKGTGVGAGSFQTIDRFEFELNKHSAAYGVSVDGSGNVHVTGHGFTAVGSYQPGHWITRRLSAGVWSTTDHYFLSPASSSMGLNIVADSANNVFASGLANDALGGHYWVVRRQLAP